MLVLSRKSTEKIRIGEEIEISVIAISGGKVRIGISAPKSTRIVRSELLIEEPGREAVHDESSSPARGRFPRAA